MTTRKRGAQFVLYGHKNGEGVRSYEGSTDASTRAEWRAGWQAARLAASLGKLVHVYWVTFDGTKVVSHSPYPILCIERNAK